jgi:hypothetical protein
MRKHFVLWPWAPLFALIETTTLIACGPACLPGFLRGDGRYSEGHSASYWVDAPLLRALLNDPDPDLRYVVADALESIEGKAPGNPRASR